MNVKEISIPKLYENKEDCCGCAACYSICLFKNISENKTMDNEIVTRKLSNGAISMVEDEEGFLYPKIDENRCVRCMKCIAVCPIKS